MNAITRTNVVYFLLNYNITCMITIKHKINISTIIFEMLLHYLEEEL